LQGRGINSLARPVSTVHRVGLAEPLCPVIGEEQH
jgi:hypothetical protein